MRSTHPSGIAVALVLAMLIALGAGRGVSAADASVGASPESAPLPTANQALTPTPTSAPSFFPTSFDFRVAVVQPDSRDERGWSSLEGWRIKAAFENVIVNGAQPVTEALGEDDVAEAWWDVEAQGPTIGVSLTVVPHRGYRPLRAGCGHSWDFDGGRDIPLQFHRNTIAFTDQVMSQTDFFSCFLWYRSAPSSSVSPAVPPTDTSLAEGSVGAEAFADLAVVSLAGVMAAAAFLMGYRQRREASEGEP